MCVSIALHKCSYKIKNAFLVISEIYVPCRIIHALLEPAYLILYVIFIIYYMSNAPVHNTSMQCRGFTL